MTARVPLIEEVHMAPGPAWCFEAFAPLPYSFFLDSGMDPAKLGRYSFLGSDPFLVMKSRGEAVTIVSEGKEEVNRCSPFDVLGELLDIYTLDATDYPVPFIGGAVGYFSYDLGRLIERLPSTAVDDLALPECCLGFYDAVVAHDHLTGRTYIVSTGFPELNESKRLSRARRRLLELKNRVLLSPPPPRNEFQPPEKVSIKSNFSHDDYLKAVETAREYICAGDIFQVNLSQRLEAEIAMPPYELYRRLRAVNPAPFANYFSFDDVAVVGASPERFMKLTGDRVETRPIKGTRPRGRTPEEDKELASQLLASVKDKAENVMIVDLERNDIGRVCRYGSVAVTELAILETYPTVYHLTSTVVGRLSEGKNRIDLLKAAFPGGSITGAPKVRSMEIIEELEPTRRSVYTGSLGYLGFNGDMDLDIVIRTILIKGNRVYFQVGGAITYDSDPESEYVETLDKGRALILALQSSPDSDVEIVT